MVSKGCIGSPDVMSGFSILDSLFDYGYILALVIPGETGQKIISDLNPRIRECDDEGFCVIRGLIQGDRYAPIR